MEWLDVVVVDSDDSVVGFPELCLNFNSPTSILRYAESRLDWHGKRAARIWKWVCLRSRVHVGVNQTLRLVSVM